MIFNIASQRHKKDLKEKEFTVWFEKQKRWQQFFAVIPRRISYTEVACLQWITRRVDPEQPAYKGVRDGIDWQYGPLINLLQPMESLYENAARELSAGDIHELCTISIPPSERGEDIRKVIEESGLGGYFQSPKD